MHRKHVIDPGTKVTEGSGAWEWGGYSGEVRGAPPPEKLQRTSTSKAPAQLYRPLPLIFGI